MFNPVMCHEILGWNIPEHFANIDSPCKRAGKAQLLLVSEHSLFSIGTKRGGTLMSHFPYEKC